MNVRAIRPGLAVAAGCLILLSASLVSCQSATADNQMPATANATRPAGLPARTPTASPTRPAATTTPADSALHIIANGRLSFVDDRPLTFRTGGNVAQVNISELDRVTKGQVLARLDTTSLEQAVRTAELGVKTAELAQQTAKMDRIQAEYSANSTAADLRAAQNNVKSAAIDLDTATDNFRKITYPYTYSTFTFDVPQALVFFGNANRQVNEAVNSLQAGQTSDQYYAALRQLRDALDNLTKGRELLNRGQGQDPFVSGLLTAKDFWTLRAAQQAMDKAQLTLENTQNALGKTILTVDGARNALNKAQVAVDKSNNDIDIARNNLGIARTNLENAIITSPFDGVAARVTIKVGDYLSSSVYSSTVAVEVIDPRRMELDIMVNELDISGVKVGQKVTVSVDAEPGKTFQSTVASVGSLPSVTAGVMSYEVKILFDVPANSGLKSGMAATADILTK